MRWREGGTKIKGKKWRSRKDRKKEWERMRWKEGKRELWKERKQNAAMFLKDYNK